MPKSERTLTREDVLAPEEYERIRKEKRREHIARKRLRRVEVGPHVTVIFENWDSMWYQVHEMLHVERGGEEQIADELAAYGPLVPNGRELVATVMFEIEDPERRDRILARLGGVERTMSLQFDGEIVRGVPEHDVERSTADGRTSSVHFMHFPMTDEQAATFKRTTGPVVFAIEHENYRHLAVVPPEVVEELKNDLA